MNAPDESSPRPLQVGDTAPSFSLPTVDGHVISLEDALQNGHSAVLVFLRHPG